MVDVLTNDNGVVHHDAQRDEIGEQRDHVDGNAEQRQEEKGAHKGKGDTHHHPEGQPQFKKKRQGEEHEDKAHGAVAQQQIDALGKHLRAVAQDIEFYGGGQFRPHLGNMATDRCRDLDGCLVADAVNIEHDRRITVVGGVIVGVLIAVTDRGDLFKGQPAAVRLGDDRQPGEFPAEITSFRDADENFAAPGLDGAARQVDGCVAQPLGEGVDGQPVTAQIFLGNLDADLQRSHAGKVDLGDFRILQQPIPHLFSQFMQGRGRRRAGEDDGDRSSFAGLHPDLGLFRILRKGGDAVDFALDVLAQPVHVGAGQGLDDDRCHALGSGGSDFVDAVEGADCLLDGQDDAGFHLVRTGAGIGDSHPDYVHFKFRKNLLANGFQKKKSADQTGDHEQVGGHGVTSHPGDGAAVLSRGTAGHQRRSAED